MRVYVGQTRSSRLIAELAELGFGECTQRGENAARRQPWFLDNGAFTDFKAGRDFDGAAWCETFARHRGAPAPDFVVLPDIVGGGRRSLDFSIDWYATTRELCLETWQRVPPLYVAVQDGMTAADVDEAIGFGDGVFVGGSLEWKLLAAPGIIERAHGGGTYVDGCPPLDLPKPVHVGRVGSGRRIVWSRFCEADSIDSCLPLWAADKREIAAFAAGAELGSALDRFPAGGTLAADAWCGVVRRQALRGDLDAGTVRRLAALEQRRAS